MKRYLIIGILMLVAPFLRAQDVIFWTNEKSSLPIRVYVDKEYIGDVTETRTRQPQLGDPGCLHVLLAPGEHELTAVNRYGELYDGWTDRITPKVGETTYLKINKGNFRTLSEERRNDEELFWLWYGWDPIFRPVPIVFHRPHDLDIDLDDDEAAIVTMAVATVGGLAALTAAAVCNWNIPDSRFPYFSAGYKFEYLYGLEEFRNVARLKYRFGNLGGMSLIGDIGYRVIPGTRDIYYMDSRTSYDGLTWSLGFAMEYGGFNFGVRCKPAFGDLEDSFLVADIDYDFIIGQHFILSLNSGFGVCGYGANNLADYITFPVGIGFSYKF